MTVPAGGSVILGGKGNASAAVAEIGESVKDGNAQKVTFTFSKTGDVSLRAFVVPAESYFSKWGPTDSPVGAGRRHAEPPAPREPASRRAASGCRHARPARPPRARPAHAERPRRGR